MMVDVILTSTFKGSGETMDFRPCTKEKEWLKYLDKPDNEGFYRCIYCGQKVKYIGSCRQCGDAEDCHLRQGFYAE